MYIQEEINTIGENAFSGCTGLTELTLPSTLTEIGAGAFCNSVALKTIYCDINKDIDGKLIEYNDNIFPASFNVKTEIFIPEGSISAYQGQDGWKSYFDNYIEGRRIPEAKADGMHFFIKALNRNACNMITICRKAIIINDR